MDENNNLDSSNVSQISFSEFNNSFFGSTVQFSTPRKKKVVTPKKTCPVGVAKTRALQKTKATFAVPKPIMSCPHCQKPYKTKRYYNQHLLMHKIQDGVSKYPDHDFLLSSSSVICERAMKRISELPCFGESGRKYTQLVEKVMQAFNSSDPTKEFCKSVCGYFASPLSMKKFILPSALWTSIFVEIERVLSSPSLRASLEELIFQTTSVSDSKTIQVFICDFVLYTAEELFTFIRESVVNVPLPQKQVIALDHEDRQSIHYIGGSIMHQFRKRGRRYSGNKEWQQIVHVIQTRVDEENPEVEPALDADKEWTANVNRGGLLVIGAKCMNVFLAITAVLCNITESNGTVILEKVFNSIYNSPLPSIWDNMVGRDMLDESVSLNFMNGVVKSYSQTFGRGLLNRKLNELYEKPFTSINLRHVVAPKGK